MAMRTPLYVQHQAANARMVEFFGWDMPLHYGSQIEEHHQVRRDAGIFDVSHMTIVDLLGVGGRTFLRYLLASDVDRLQPGKALYTCLLNDRAGVIDDLIVYARAQDSYRLVLNAATREKDLKWIETQAKGFSVGLQVRSELAMIAVQGPKAIEKIQSLFHPILLDNISTLSHFEFAEHEAVFVAKTGYTGEAGLEIVMPAEKVASFWEAALALGVKPCGLGARDTLRLEAGLNLYGADMTEQTSPLESNLAWVIHWDPADRDFVGRAALENQKREGIKKKLVGLVLEEKGVLRAHQKVILSDGTEGEITSGTFSPTLGVAIALARVPANAGDQCAVEIRGKQHKARIVKPRFVKYGRSLIE